MGPTEPPEKWSHFRSPDTERGGVDAWPEEEASAGDLEPDRLGLVDEDERLSFCGDKLEAELFLSDSFGFESLDDANGLVTTTGSGLILGGVASSTFLIPSDEPSMFGRTLDVRTGITLGAAGDWLIGETEYPPELFSPDGR